MRDPEDVAAEFAASKDWYVSHIGGVAYVPLDELAALVEVADAAVRLAKVLDLASSVHTPERRAARLAFYDALRNAGLRA